ncbi:MAG: hydroxymethylglutaryl-CoA lyase [Bacteroidota bacterium]
MIPSVKIIECPRDAMQGVKSFIPTSKKVTYINSLLKVGFDTIDFGSFVSPQAIPQMKDTAEVLKKLDMSQTTSKLLAIIGNTRGATEAASYEQISYIGFPFSISETFLTRNLNSTIDKSKKTVSELLDICDKNKKQAVIYISMAFGNPYGDEWNVDFIARWVEVLFKMGVQIIPLSDTIGSSNAKSITTLFTALIPAFPSVEFGFHLHTPTLHWYNKVNAAFKSGCRRFDTAINGLGGCPMASEGQLVGNLRTSNILEYFEANNIPSNLNEEEFLKAYLVALRTFPTSSFVK